MIFVSHDRWFVSQLATRVVEIKPGEILDYQGTYEEYVHYCGDDHLDADTVVLKARRAKRQAKKVARELPEESAQRKRQPSTRSSKNRIHRMKSQRDEVIARIEEAEARIGEINELFCDPGFYDRTGPDEVRALEGEQTALRNEVEELTAKWEKAEEELALLT